MVSHREAEIIKALEPLLEGGKLTSSTLEAIRLAIALGPTDIEHARDVFLAAARDSLEAAMAYAKAPRASDTTDLQRGATQAAQVKQLSYERLLLREDEARLTERAHKVKS